MAPDVSPRNSRFHGMPGRRRIDGPGGIVIRLRA